MQCIICFVCFFVSALTQTQKEFEQEPPTTALRTTYCSDMGTTSTAPNGTVGNYLPRSFFFNNLLLLLFVSAHTFVANEFVDVIVDEPYMDEVFHVNQTQRFCEIFNKGAGQWTVKDLVDSYDPKITTPPGPYLFASAYSINVLKDKACSLGSIRSMNVVFNAGTVVVLSALLERFYRRSSNANHILRICFLALSPVHFFFAFLFYTDSGSTFFVVLTYYMSMKINLAVLAKPSPTFARDWLVGLFLPVALCSLFGFVSLWFRQTNIVWFGFVIGATVLRATSERSLEESDRTGTSVSGEGVSPVDGLVAELLDVLMSILGAIKYAVGDARAFAFGAISLVPPVAVIAAFAAFLKWNDMSIVLGDKEHHVPVFHVPQLYYFVLYVMLPFNFSMVSEHGVMNIVNAMMSISLKTMLLTFLFIVWTIHTCTKVHPFILADNRHYTFYIWSKVMRHSVVRYALAVVYMFCGTQLVARIASVKRSLWAIGFVLCTCAVLVPAHLVEFRYWVIPSIFVNLHLLQKREIPYLALAVFSYILGNAALVYIFLFRPFQMESGQQGRFMF